MLYTLYILYTYIHIYLNQEDLFSKRKLLITGGSYEMTIICLIVCTSLSAGRGWTSYQILKKGGLDRTSTFRGVGEKEVDNFFQGGGVQFLHKR